MEFWIICNENKFLILSNAYFFFEIDKEPQCVCFTVWALFNLLFVYNLNLLFVYNCSHDFFLAGYMHLKIPYDLIQTLLYQNDLVVIERAGTVWRWLELCVLQEQTSLPRPEKL